MQMKRTKTAILLAISAAALYGISTPISKLLLEEIPPMLLAALLYLGAGFGMSIVVGVRRVSGFKKTEAPVTRKEIPYLIGMILLDILAPILLLIGLTLSSAESVSLLNNFEIVATAMIALLLFHESIGTRMWYAIALITLASILLSIGDIANMEFSLGSLLVLGACFCWGLENNFTRMLSIKDPLQVVIMKGFGSGFGSLVIAMVLKQYSMNFLYIIGALVLGFVAYGLSIYFYVRSQRELGAARTSAYYATAPFIGVIISWVIFMEEPSSTFIIALIIMIVGTYFVITEHHVHSHVHEAIVHEHKHVHSDDHHLHQTIDEEDIAHSHAHIHEKFSHQHDHTPDLHHRHNHR
jgi:drug/metabolite transporter (DMT)-like permease